MYICGNFKTPSSFLLYNIIFLPIFLCCVFLFLIETTPTMAFLRFIFSLLVLLCVIALLSPLVHCKDEDENNLLQGINSYRTSLNLPVLNKNKKAGCLADEVANRLEDQPCPRIAAAPARISDYTESLDKCGIDVNHTRDGMVLPVCVHDLVPTLVLTNYTHGQYSRYVNDSRFTGVGLGSEDDWMVLVLSTNTLGGDLGGANCLVSKVGFGHVLVTMFVGLKLVGFV